MNIFECRFENWTKIVISFNWVALVLLIVAALILPRVVKWLYDHLFMKSVIIEETSIGIGNSSITVKYDGRIKAIAYKIRIELITRKIGIMFDEDHDVITEVYDSWYEAFRIIRGLLEDIPPERIADAAGLIDISTKVLNKGLRPHLTQWQAKYRKWYNIEVQKNEEDSPQEIQKRYPEYQQLVDDLKRTNEIMINYATQLKHIIDKK